MALLFNYGSVQWLTTDALNSTKVITGLGFPPRAIRFYWMGLQTNSPTNASSQIISERRGIGFASSATSRRSVGTFSGDNLADSDCGSVASNDCVVVTVTGAGVIDGKLDVSSFDANGFTLMVDDATPANLTIFYEVWGGDEISAVTIGDIAEPAAVGVQTYTATNFKTYNYGVNDQVVMLAGVQSTAAVNTGQANDSGFYAGFTTGTAAANNIVVLGNSDDASATMDTVGYARAGECVAMIVVAGGNPNARATLSAYGINTFSLNWTTRATTNRRSIYMAIKGGGWQVGSYTIRQDSGRTAAVTGLPFILRGISIMGARKTQSTAGTSSVQDSIGFGTAMGTAQRQSMSILDENATATSEIDAAIEYNSLLVFPSATGGFQARYNVNAWGQNNFTTVVSIDAGGPENEWQGYLSFGNLPGPRTRAGAITGGTVIMI
jgi:hypothetical protein